MLFYDRNTLVIFQNVHDGFKELSLLIAQCELFFKFFDSLAVDARSQNISSELE